jgi:hypothetical protein
MARPTWAIERHGDDSLIVVQSSSAGYAFGVQRGTLGHIRGSWPRKIVNHGLNHLGFTAPQREAPDD